MELRNGFIVGIFNYCDRWCDACAFTSRCRLFADKAETEASLDPALKALVEAPPLEPAPPPPPWLEELLQEMDRALHQPADDQQTERPIPLEHASIERRARGYCRRVYRWLKVREFAASHDPADPRAVIRWFHAIITARIHRALHGLANDEPEDRDWPPDYEGSAKVALLGIERSQAAWIEMLGRGIVSDADAAPFVADLVWLAEALERVFPNARGFVRPAFDEPDQVSQLLPDA